MLSSVNRGQLVSCGLQTSTGLCSKDATHMGGWVVQAHGNQTDLLSQTAYAYGGKMGEPEIRVPYMSSEEKHDISPEEAHSKMTTKRCLNHPTISGQVRILRNVLEQKVPENPGKFKLIEAKQIPRLRTPVLPGKPL